MPWNNPIGNMTAEHIAQQHGSYEPQRTNNFMLTFPDVPGDPTGSLLELSLTTSLVPNETQDAIEINFMNEKVKVAGITTFEAGSVSYYDYIDTDTSGILARWRKMVYDADTGKIGLARDYKRNGKLRMFGPAGGGDKQWVLLGCWPSQITWAGSLDMATVEANKIEVQITYDKAKPLDKGMRTVAIEHGYMGD